MIAGLAMPESTEKIKKYLKNVVLIAPLTLMTPPTELNSITNWIESNHYMTNISG